MTELSNWITTLLDRMDGPTGGEPEPNLTTPPAQACPRYGETLWFVALFGALIFLLSRPAFDGFFYGEDFEWIAAYILHGGDFLKAIFSPLATIAFRPAAAFWLLGSQLLLPWDPLLHHIRNFAFTLVDLWVLHRIMLRLTRSRAARGVGLAFFAVSKVHLVTIGALASMANVIALTHFLPCLFFLIRHLQERRRSDYWLSIVFFMLTAFTRDYSVVLLFVLLAVLAFATRGNPPRALGRANAELKFLPYVVTVAVYLAARFSIVGLPPVGGQVTYGMWLNWPWIWERIILFAGNLLNLSLSTVPSVTGAGDLSTLLTNDEAVQQTFRVVFLILGWALMVYTAVCAVRRKPWYSIALLWALIIIAPTFVVRNRQVYYIFESVGAMGLFLALCLDRGLSRRGTQFGLWSVALMIIAVNGYATNQNVDILWWRGAQTVSRIANEQIFVPNRGVDVRSLTILAPSPALAQRLENWIMPIGKQQMPMARVLMSSSLEKLEFTTAEEYLVGDLAMQGNSDLVYFLDARDQYGLKEFSFTRMYPALPAACQSFEGDLTALGAAWVFNTETDLVQNSDPAYVSDGRRSIGVSVVSMGSADYHYGGVELPLATNREFMLDMWVDRPENLKAIYVYEMDDQGYPINAWINSEPPRYLAPGVMNSLTFELGIGNVHGFDWTPQERAGTPNKLHVFVDALEGGMVRFFVDRLCELAVLG